MVIVSAPGKLFLFGEYSVLLGYPAIITAVNRRMQVSMEERGDSRILVRAPEVGLREFTELSLDRPTSGVQFLAATLIEWKKVTGQVLGLDIDISSSFTDQVGLGSSAALTIACLKGLAELTDHSLDPSELFQRGFQVVHNVQGGGSGADLASAIHGGTIYFKDEGRSISSLETPPIPLVCVYTGFKVRTSQLVQIFHIWLQSGMITKKTLGELATITLAARESMSRGDWQTTGVLMSRYAHLIENLAGTGRGFGSGIITDISEVSKSSNAFGGKMSGAGIGDCFIILTSDPEKCTDEFKKRGYEVLDITCNEPGVRVEHS